MTAPDPAYPFNDPALAGFAFERELRGGGMARLFIATDRQFDRRVVIKVLVPTEERGLSADRFRREIAVATAMQHPNIVPILSAGELGGEPPTPFLVMPYVEGESLRDRLLRGPLSIREALHIARDVARALSFAHRRGIVHRDIKPGNVLMASGAAVVSDFGVAKALTISRQQGRGSSGERPMRSQHQSLTAIGTSLGTPAYMAPEQAAADPNIDHRADLYALGIVLYEMLVGAPPFHGRSPQELLRAQLADPPPPIGSLRYGVPARLAELIEHLLEKDPARRPPNADDVLRRLEDPAIQSGAFAAPRTNAKRLRRRTFGVLGVVIAAVAAMALFFFKEEESAAPPPAPMQAIEPWRRRLTIGAITAIDADTRQRSLIAGLRSELVTVVARVPGMRVGAESEAVARPRNSADAFAADSLQRQRPTEDVLRLEGTVQRERLQYRVLLRAIDARADSVVWTGAFDGHADSVLALQSRVADAVANVLAFMTPPRRAP